MVLGSLGAYRNSSSGAERKLWHAGTAMIALIMRKASICLRSGFFRHCQGAKERQRRPED